MKGIRRVAWMLLVLLVASLNFAPALAEAPEDVLGELKGTYEELFTVLNAPSYDGVWLENCAKYVGAENAQATADMLRGMVVGELTGQAAIDAYTLKPEDAKYNCFFLQGVSRLTFDGKQINGVGADGAELFAHTYTFVSADNELGFSVYKSDDADSGEFSYFAFAPDTPETTFHIEFRYGSDPDALVQKAAGAYAYWMAAGIPVERDDSMAASAIALFCEENLKESDEAA